MLEEFQQKLGYTFKNPQLLQNALTLAGFAAPAAVQPESTEDGVAYFSDGVQLVHTTLDYRSYAPITVKAGFPSAGRSPPTAAF